MRGGFLPPLTALLLLDVYDLSLRRTTGDKISIPPTDHRTIEQDSVVDWGPWAEVPGQYSGPERSVITVPTTEHGDGWRPNYTPYDGVRGGMRPELHPPRTTGHGEGWGPNYTPCDGVQKGVGPTLKPGCP